MVKRERESSIGEKQRRQHLLNRLVVDVRNSLENLEDYLIKSNNTGLGEYKELRRKLETKIKLLEMN